MVGYRRLFFGKVFLGASILPIVPLVPLNGGFPREFEEEIGLALLLSTCLFDGLLAQVRVILARYPLNEALA
jgi:hypothetical protein